MSLPPYDGANKGESQMTEQHSTDDNSEFVKGWTARATYSVEGVGRIQIEFATVDELVERTDQMDELMWPKAMVFEDFEIIEPTP